MTRAAGVGRHLYPHCGTQIHKGKPSGAKYSETSNDGGAHACCCLSPQCTHKQLSNAQGKFGLTGKQLHIGHTMIPLNPFRAAAE